MRLQTLTRSLATVIAAILAIAAGMELVSCDRSGTPPLLPGDGRDAASALLPESDLSTGCYGWPEQDFSPDNHAVIGVLGHVGDPAVDFTLLDIDGTPHRLSELLESRPVLLVLGSYT